MTFSEQQPLFSDTKSGRYTQVWLYHTIGGPWQNINEGPHKTNFLSIYHNFLSCSNFRLQFSPSEIKTFNRCSEAKYLVAASNQLGFVHLIEASYKKKTQNIFLLVLNLKWYGNMSNSSLVFLFVSTFVSVIFLTNCQKYLMNH